MKTPFATALLLLLALLPWSWLAATQRDLPQFGKYQDDGLFLTAAQSLRGGGGYRIASLPSKPFQTKYQPLYPVLLAALWAPDLSSTLPLAAALQWGVVAGFFALALALFRAFGFAPWKCALMTVGLGINPWLLYWGLLPISDFLFAALVLAVFLLLQKASPRWTLIALLAAAAYLTKVAGILILPALFFAAPRKRALFTGLPLVAAFGAWTLWAQFHRSPLEHSVAWYYTDYLGFFLKNDGAAALPRILQTNFVSLVMLAGDSLLHNLSESMFGRFASVIVFAAALSGTRRLIRRTGSSAYPVFCGLLLLLLAAWNFSPNVRLAAPLLPLLAMALWEEGEHVAGLIAQSARSRKASDRAAAFTFRAALLAGLVCAAVLNVQFIFRDIPELLAADRAAASEEQRLFAWCRQNLPPSAVVLANNDTRLYLTTGLSAVRPVPNSVAFYTGDGPGQLENFTHFDRLQKAFGLTHILLTPSDFGDFDPAQRKQAIGLLRDHPGHKEVFRSGAYAVLEILPASTLSAVSGR